MRILELLLAVALMRSESGVCVPDQRFAMDFVGAVLFELELLGGISRYTGYMYSCRI